MPEDEAPEAVEETPAPVEEEPVEAVEEEPAMEGPGGG